MEQSELAEMLGRKSASSISEWESGNIDGLKKESEVMEDNTILEVREMQKEIDHRTEIENEAIKLISECKFKEAIELLATI